MSAYLSQCFYIRWTPREPTWGRCIQLGAVLNAWVERTTAITDITFSLFRKRLISQQVFSHHRLFTAQTVTLKNTLCDDADIFYAGILNFVVPLLVKMNVTAKFCFKCKECFRSHFSLNHYKPTQTTTYRDERVNTIVCACVCCPSWVMLLYRIVC